MIFDLGEPVLLPHKDRNVTSCAVAPKQSLLATGSGNGTVHLWELVMCELITSLVGPDDDVLPPGAVAPAAEGTAGLGSAVAGGNSLVPPEDRLGTLIGDENGKPIVNPPARTILHVTPRNRFTGTPNTQTDAYSVGAKMRAVGETPRPVHTATDRSGQRAVAEQQRRLDALKSKSVLSVGEAPTTTRVRNTAMFHSGLAVNGLSFGGDGTVLASCGEDGSFYIFDISGIAPKATVGDTSAGSRQQQQQQQQNKVAPVVKWRRLAGHGGSPLLQCLFSPNSLLIATCGKDSTVMLWGSLGRPVCGRLSGHQNWVACVAFSHDSTYMVSGGHDHAIVLWNCRSFQQMRTARVHNAPVLCACFTVENTVIATGDDDGYIFLTRAADGAVLRSVRGHFDSVTSIVFAESLGCFLTTSHDSSLRVWSLRAECVEAFKAHRGRIHALALSLHDELIVTAGADSNAAVIPFSLKDEGED